MTPRAREIAARLAGALALLGATGAAPPRGTPPVPPVSHPAAAPPPAGLRWTDATPNAMIDDAAARATAPGATEGDVLAASFVLHALDPRADSGRAEAALRGVAARVGGEAAGDVALLARSLASDEGSPAGASADEALGVLTHLALLGPFRDTGGGLDAHDGPEAKGASFADTKASYSWGTVQVGWREVPRLYAPAEGVPLDLFIAPRTESCSFVATAVRVTTRERLVVRVASSGSVRLVFDGADVGRSEDVETSSYVDRLAAEVDALPGVHLVAAKVCSGALGDDGRVRLRLTDMHGAPLVLSSSADLSTIDPSRRAAAAASAPPSGADPALAAAKARETPLGRALSGRPHTFASELDEVVARTLGGADDTRSPRAQGLIADLAARPDLGADTLAFLGWLSPSGATRSMLLNLAMGRGAGVDAGARAFSERRLIASRLGARLTDWALATARGAHLGEADGEAVLLQALLDDALGTDALRTAALRRLERYVKGRPHEAPTALLLELAHLAAPYDQGELGDVRELLAGRGYRGHDLVSAMAARSPAALIEAARTAFEGNLDDADDGLAVADALARAGRHDEAAAAYGRLTQWAPNRFEVWVGLARELSATAEGDQAARIPPILARARELAPGDASLRAEVALRQGSKTKGGTDATARDDEKYLVPAATFLSRRGGVPATGVPDVADRELYWLRAVVLHPDRRVSQLIQYAREIVVPPRTADDLLEDIPAEGDLTEILRARVYRKDGEVAFPTEQRDEGAHPSIRWPDLEPGDTVEVAIRTWTHDAVGGRGDAPFYFMDYAGASPTHPLLYNEVVVEAPRSAPIYIDVLHDQGSRREERDDGDRHVTRLVWDHPVVIPDEPLAPSLSEVAPLIVGSTFHTWADFRSWYLGAVQGFAIPDDEVRRRAEELTRGKTTRESKLRALFDFVADDIRYVNFQSGEGWLPNRPQQLLARREGDCDDKAMLLITLLSAIGIHAEEVLVQTRERGQPSIVLAKNAAVPMFDHGIAFLPGPGGGEYLDATSPESRLGPLPSMDARAPAFRLEDGPAVMTHLPSSSPGAHGSDVRWNLALHEGGSADLTGEESAVGDAAFWLRTSLTQPDARADYVRDHLVAPWLPTVTVDRKVEFKGNLPGGGAWVKYAARAEGVARREDGGLTLPVGQTTSLASNLAPLVTRTLPVVLPPSLAPSHQERTTRVTAPAGFTWARLPPGGDETDGEFGHAHLGIAKDPRDPRAVVVTRSLVFDADVIPASKYLAWRAWLQRVDRLMHKELRLVRAPEAR